MIVGSTLKTYTTVYPDADREVITRLSALRTNHVQVQAVLRERGVKAEGVRTVTNAGVAVSSGIARLLKRLGKRLWRRKTQGASRRLRVGNAEEEFLRVVLVAHTDIGAIGEIDRRFARVGLRLGQCQERQERQKRFQLHGRHVEGLSRQESVSIGEKEKQKPRVRKSK